MLINKAFTASFSPSLRDITLNGLKTLMSLAVLKMLKFASPAKLNNSMILNIMIVKSN